MSWYRQYRPTTISGLHLIAVRQQLEKLVAGKTFPHALLLTGPRGAGKTSTARIIAAMLNDPVNAKGPPFTEPNQKDELVQRIIQGSSLAVHELDAASHRGIDDVRALKEQAYLPPQEGKTLVFILDEVHMLTTEAFNALLKLLEEPPSDVVFILATTEEQKVPATIASRCTVIHFSKASEDEMKAALQPIIKDQKLEIEPAALTAITQAADGSFRDAVKVLETVAAGVKKITAEHVQTFLHATPTAIIHQLIGAITSKNEREVVGVFEQLRASGTDQKQFLQTLLTVLHQDLMTAIISPAEAKYSKKISQFLLTHFSSIEINQFTPIPLLPIELKALELVFRAQEKKNGNGSGGGLSEENSSVTAAKSSSSASTSPKTSSFVVTPPQADKVLAGDQVVPIADSSLSMTFIEKWADFIVVVQQHNSSLAALLRSARPSLTAAGSVCVEVFYQFHRDQLRQSKFLRLLEESSALVVGQAVRFEFQLAQSGQLAESLSTITVPSKDNDQFVQLAQEVFL